MLVNSLSKFGEALERLERCGNELVCDIETVNGLDMFAKENPARICAIQLGHMHEDGADAYFPYRHGSGFNLPLELMEPLRKLLKGKTLLFFNAMFDVRVMHFDGFSLPDKIEDAQGSSFLADENEPKLSLKPLSVKHLGAGADDEETELKAELRKRGFSTASGGKEFMYMLEPERVAPYGLKDIKITRDLHKNRMQVVRKWRMEHAYHELCAYLRVLIKMSLRGLPFSIEEAERQRAKIGPRLLEMEARMREVIGDINFNSTKQLAEALGLPSTKKEYLEDLLIKTPDERFRLVLDWRVLRKADDAFFTPYIAKTDINGRLHTAYRVFRAKTGRLSSADVNLQQISRDQSNRGYSLKSCFIAEEGKLLLSSDLQAAEPRICAYMANEPTMIKAFLSNTDYHTAIARQVFRKDNISGEERTSAKVVGLGVLYNLGATKSARKLALRHEKMPGGGFARCNELVWCMDKETDSLRERECSDVDAEFCTYEGRAFVNKFFEGVSELKPYRDAVTRVAERNGYVRHPHSGRVRRLGSRYAFKALNFLAQHGCAYMLQRITMELDKQIDPTDAQLLHSVHDDLQFEIVQGPRMDQTIEQIKHIITSTVTLGPVPVVTDTKIGKSLGSLVKV